MSTENIEIDDTENSLNAANVHTIESRDNEQDFSTKDSQTRRPRPSIKSNANKLTNEVLTSVKEHFKRPAPQEDRYDLFGKTIAMKLRTLEKKQRLIAEKIINDTLFEAELGNITHRSQYSTGQYISSLSPTYISSPIASPNSSSTESSGPIMMQQAQTVRSLSNQDNHSSSTQNSYIVQVPQTPPVLSIPEETLSASSYYSNINLVNL
nr:unnamed protein product [Callosobruchus analis]